MDILQQAFDPEKFRKEGHAMIDLLAEHLQKMQSPYLACKVFDRIPPNELFDRWKKDFENPTGELYQESLKEANLLHHPKYLGHQTSVPSPDAVLAELFGGFLDMGMGIYEQGTTGVVLEKLIIEILAKKIGIPEKACGGFLSSGGTLGNLTALLCARAVKIESDVWEKGYQGKQYAFMVSEEAHYSVERAIRVMGLGAEGIIKIPRDAFYRMDTSLLDQYFEEAKARDVEVIGVIANACATAVGAHDDIVAIADFCGAKNLWFHIDAAHGGALLFSKKYRHFLNGIERADSVIIDFHKMLLTPSLVTAVIFKNGNHAYQTFTQKASYLWDNPESQEWYNLGKRTFELTKTTMSFRVYTMLRQYGDQLFETYLDRQYDLARTFAKMIRANGHFEMPVDEPESNIVCFRYLDENLSEDRLNQRNIELREIIVQEGEFFIVQTRLDNKVFLRTTIVNPFTTTEHLQELLDKICSVNKR